MTIGFLGTGVWGFCLARLLALKGNPTISWSRNAELAHHLTSTREHPFLPGHPAPMEMTFTNNLKEAIQSSTLFVESVTSAGIRPVFKEALTYKLPICPIVITSKGIEQNTGLILPQVLTEVLGKEYHNQIACLSGPSYAEEVIRGLPTSVVLAAYDSDLMLTLCDLFSTPSFRVYPNEDLHGVAYGGSLKNIIAIACGIAEGLGMGYSTKAAIMTRGLHEIKKLAMAKGCKPETLYGLSGMGDLCLTCGSLISRNSRFGYLLANGLSAQEAQKQIGMVVEGAYTCVSAFQLSQKMKIPMPITEMVYRILYDKLPIKQAVQKLMERAVKAEHL
jgi:glycerol-3-phosphate dehydrogenase (NAD(P)+)